MPLLVYTTLICAAADETSFRAAILDGIRLFSDIRRVVRESVIKPAEHDQALRYLRRLSYCLDALAQEKDNFASEVRKAKWPGDQHVLLDEAHDVIASVWRVEHTLARVFEALPDSFRVRGGTVQSKLEASLNSKLESLEAVARFVGASSPSRESILNELKKDADATRKLKDEVDALIVELDASK
jgi:hypothetical protein